MYRTHHCGALRIEDVGKEVSLCGWVQAHRKFGGLIFVDIRDRYGITQLVFDENDDAELCRAAEKLGREFVVKASGTVRERSNKNPNRSTGDIEIVVKSLKVLNEAKVPPFTIEDESDGGDDLRMKYRYLDLRRRPIQDKILFRSVLAMETRKYLMAEDFLEIETPVLIKSTPEGARDFVVPSRMNPGQFYALPQSPQTFKQILMVAGMDKYFQIVKCFRDEDLRSDRQPEFTQIDCEMSFVSRDDVLETFEGLTKYLFKTLLAIDLPDFPSMSYDKAMATFGTDKPDLRFGMPLVELTDLVKGKGFKVFDDAETILAINAEGQAAQYSNKAIAELTDWVKRPQIGAKGLVYVKWNEDGSFRSSVGKFYQDPDLEIWAEACHAKPGDMLLILSGERDETRKQVGELRLEVARRMELIDPSLFKPLWIVDFPLLEWDDEGQRFHAMHHPFTSPKKDDIEVLRNMAENEELDHQRLKSLRADAYDLVINGSEIGGGSIRIHDKHLQQCNFKVLGFTPEEAQSQFGFLLGAFEYGAPPHGGIAFGFDRLCTVMKGTSSIRDFIAFPKNNMGRDMMIDAPSPIDPHQLEELGLRMMDPKPGH